MKIGIDLGTANVLVYVKGKGIVITEPSVVAVSDDNRIVAVGEEARAMIGRTPGNIQAIRPMKDGVIADYVITEAMLRFFIAKATKGRIGLNRPEVMISVPAGVTSVEKRAVRDAALKAGAKEAFLIEEPLAAAIGANVPISGPSGNMIIDIGGGTSEIAVIALGGIVVSHSLRVGGNKFDEAIATYIRKKYNLMIGERTAEEVKMQIGTALPLERELTMEVRGRDLIAGLPRTIPITSSEVMEAIEAPLQQLVAAVRTVLEQTPPELSSDIIDKGMVMSGGGALLRNVDKLLTQVTGVPCHVAENSLDCVALGTGLRWSTSTSSRSPSSSRSDRRGPERGSCRRAVRPASARSGAAPSAPSAGRPPGATRGPAASRFPVLAAAAAPPRSPTGHSAVAWAAGVGGWRRTVPGARSPLAPAGAEGEDARVRPATGPPEHDPRVHRPALPYVGFVRLPGAPGGCREGRCRSWPDAPGRSRITIGSMGRSSRGILRRRG